MSLRITHVALHASEKAGERRFASRSEVLGRGGMACTSHPLATQVALQILRSGGSAVDAAIAANACLCLMEPTGAGLGGDLCAFVWSAAERRLHALNATGRSPRRLRLEWFRQQGMRRIPPSGPLPVTTPGCVDGWIALHERFGRKPLDVLLEPAAASAREGFPVTELVADHWADEAQRLRRHPGFAEVFLPGGRAPRGGEIFANPDLARVLERIGREGRQGFYSGPVAEAMITYLRAQGSFLDETDLEGPHADWVSPISTVYRGFQIWELPPNSQGFSTLQILNILEGFNLRSAGWGSVAAMHLFIEAKKLAFEDRAQFCGDPAFTRLPVEELLSKDYAARRRALIDPSKAAMRFEPGDFTQRGDTVCLSTADAEGNLVSLMQSNFRGMGSGMTPPGLGFVLHSRGECFSLEEGHPNAFAPGKRPFHTIIPGFVTFGGDPWLSFGVMGADMQPQGKAQVLMNLLDFHLGLQEAGDAPRIFHAGSSSPEGDAISEGGVVYLEDGFPEESVRELARMGHRIGRTHPRAFGGYQAIRFDAERRVYAGASDSRKDGQAGAF